MAGELIDQRGDHEALAVSRFLDQFKNAAKLKALAASYAAQIQDLEDAAFEVILERVLDNAVGAQLTVIGKIVQQPRTTADDAEFKTAIRARIAINLSHGTPEDLIKVAGLILTGGERFEIREEPPAQIRITVLDPITITPELAQDLLDSADAGGVRLLLNYTSTITDARKFTFSDALGSPTTGAGFGSTVGAPSPLGYFASVED